ncbi:MAG TPA: Ig-like domain-containing protein, partial [Chitinophagaceae bacterium]|nr:Ig-like domain-containing protein [Chitinophagaceae bacterium]
MKVKSFLNGVAILATATQLFVSCKKSDLNPLNSTTVNSDLATERKFGVVEDDPKIVARVPFIISSDFINKKQESNQESILNLLRTNPVKGSRDDTSPPAVNITSPLNGSSVTPGSIVNVTVNTSDNIGVTSVTYKVDEVIVNTSTSSPFNFTWNTTGIASGSLTLTATAQDAAGNIGISSVVITVNTTVIIAPPVSTSAYQIKMPPVTNQGSEGSCVA